MANAERPELRNSQTGRRRKRKIVDMGVYPPTSRNRQIPDPLKTLYEIEILARTSRGLVGKPTRRGTGR